MADRALSRQDVEGLIARLREAKAPVSNDAAAALSHLWARAQRAELIAEVAKVKEAKTRSQVLGEVGECFNAFSISLAAKIDKEKDEGTKAILVACLKTLRDVSYAVFQLQVIKHAIKR